VVGGGSGDAGEDGTGEEGENLGWAGEGRGIRVAVPQCDRNGLIRKCANDQVTVGAVEVAAEPFRAELARRGDGLGSGVGSSMEV
jgi:hypothetical protein